MDQPEFGGPDNPNLNSSPRNVSYVEPDNLDALFAEKWSKIPAAVREGVEQHVASRLPAELLEKLYDLYARGFSISEDDAFFHFGGGMAVRNLCREKLSDDELAKTAFACRMLLPHGWDALYIGVLVAIAAKRDNAL